jgi:hypothetical protein
MLQKILSRGSKAEHIILTFDDVILKFCQLQGLGNVDKRKEYTKKIS